MQWPRRVEQDQDRTGRDRALVGNRWRREEVSTGSVVPRDGFEDDTRGTLQQTDRRSSRKGLNCLKYIIDRVRNRRGYRARRGEENVNNYQY